MMEGVQWWRCAYALASLLSVQGIKEGPNSALILLQDPCGESRDHVISACTCLCSVNLTLNSMYVHVCDISGLSFQCVKRYRMRRSAVIVI